MYIYEAKLSKDEDGFYLSFPDFQGAIADGSTIQEVMNAAVETLRLVIAEYVDVGDRLPEPTYTFSEEAGSVAIAVEVDDAFIERTKCITQKEAAEELGLSKGRISHMLNSGVLQAALIGNERLVTLASVNKRKVESIGAGRPRIEKTEDFTKPINVAYTGILQSNYLKLDLPKNQEAKIGTFQTATPIILEDIENNMVNYEGVCRLGSHEKKCLVTKQDNGLIGIIAVCGSEYMLFDGANCLDSITVYVRRSSAVGNIDPRYFID